MALRVLPNQIHHSYATSFQVAQHNLALWLIEEDATRLKKRKPCQPKLPWYHTPQLAPTSASNRQ